MTSCFQKPLIINGFQQACLTSVLDIFYLESDYPPVYLFAVLQFKNMKKILAFTIVAMGIMNATLAHAKTCDDTNSHEITLRTHKLVLNGKPRTPQPVVKAFLEDGQVSITASHYIGTVRVCKLHVPRVVLLCGELCMNP